MRGGRSKQLEFNDQLESGKDGDGEQAFACEEEEAAKTNTCSNEASTKKRKKMQKQAVSKKVKKFVWTDDKVEDLLQYINDYKTNSDFKGIDFEADLASLYAAVRKCIEDDVFQELNMLNSIHTTEKQRPKMRE